MNDPKSHQKSKLGVIFAKCAPMTPCPMHLAQPLAADNHNYMCHACGKEILDSNFN